MKLSESTPIRVLQIVGIVAVLVGTPFVTYNGSKQLIKMATCKPGNPEYEKSVGTCAGNGRSEENLAKYGDACVALIKKVLIDPNSYEDISRSGDGAGNGVSIHYRARTAGGIMRISYASCTTKTGRVEDLASGYNIDVTDVSTP